MLSFQNKYQNTINKKNKKEKQHIWTRAPKVSKRKIRDQSCFSCLGTKKLGGK